MKFCLSVNETNFYKWDHGLNRCFIETVTSSFLFIYILFFGSIQVYFYQRYSSHIEYWQRSSTFSFKLQIFLSCLLASFSLIRIPIQWLIVPGDKEAFSAYTIVVGLLYFGAWIYSIYLIFLERHRILPGLPPRGHGLCLIFFWAFAAIWENLAFINWWHAKWWWIIKSPLDKAEMSLFALRYFCTLLLFLIGIRAPALISIPKLRNLQSGINARTRHFLVGNQGLFRNNPEPNMSFNITGQTTSPWLNLVSKFKLFWPFLWPKKQPLLQLKAFLCIATLIGGRVMNVFLPITYKHIINSLSNNIFCWKLILVFIGLQLLQGFGVGGTGLLNNFRSWLWISIQQYSTRELQVTIFDHLLSLPLQWHITKKTGEILRILDRGTQSVNSILSYVTFQIAPTLVDILVAIVYLMAVFGPWYGLIVFTTMLAYIGLTVAITEWRTKYRRQMNQMDNVVSGRGVDTLLNFEAVKCYQAEDFEVGEYRKAILNYQAAEWVSSVSLNLLNSVQGAVFVAGLMSGALLCAHQISLSQLTVGDFVLFVSYIAQLYVPLNWFGTFYRSIQQALIDLENMIDLMHVPATEHSAIGAIINQNDTSLGAPLVVSGGAVEFRDVTFSYVTDDEGTYPTPTLKHLSFEVDSGKTLAIVGPSGAGKTTIVRLLFKLYQPTSGAIYIDGQDVGQVDARSLRRQIGLVPQDTVLFNQSIRYNVRYGTFEAPDYLVEKAASAAEIHDTINTFTLGYDTVVGERGLRLSGGEKQRVAIARVILKAPPIILLDEATSSLDSSTEANIQSSLAKLCAGRTTILIAHRLSTVVHADEIIVLRDGVIAQRGRHQDLIKVDGLYSEMWFKQLHQQEKQNDNNQSVGAPAPIRAL